MLDYWSMVIRQALIKRLIQKEIENYGLLKVDEKGFDFLKNPYSFMLSEDHDYSDTDEEEESFGGSDRPGTVDEELFNILKSLRKKLSKQLQLPPFVIFQDPSLEDMAIQYPISMEELQNITGVGAGKAKRYGAEFISRSLKVTWKKRKLSVHRIWLLNPLSTNQTSKYLSFRALTGKWISKILPQPRTSKFLHCSMKLKPLLTPVQKLILIIT